MWDYHILLTNIILILMKNEELLKGFLNEYSPAKVSNWLSFMPILEKPEALTILRRNEIF